jgi:multiple antibiotic resistance protein
MLSHFLYSFVALFVIIDPVGSAVIFGGLMREAPAKLRRVCAARGVLIAAVLILFFAFGGERLLLALGITLPAFRVAGGILLFLLAADMVFARQSGIRGPTLPEEREAERRHDISVFPLAFPLLAGPGALTSIVLLMARASSLTAAAGVIAALVAVMAITLLLLLAAPQITRLIGITGANVVSRVLGIILAALAAQLVIDGLIESAALPRQT